MSILKLKPSCKDYLWGGRRLAEDYGKECPGEVLAETWELSWGFCSEIKKQLKIFPSIPLCLYV